MSEDQLLTWEDLADRWQIAGPTEKARIKTVQRRARDLGVKPFTLPRQRPALIRPADVLRAEERGGAGMMEDLETRRLGDEETWRLGDKEKGRLTETEAELMASCERMVFRVAQRYYKPGMCGISQEDLEHEARVSLWKSVQRWLARDEGTKTMKFSTYVFGWMRHDLYDYILQLRDVIRVPRQGTLERQRRMRVRCVSLDDLLFEDSEKNRYDELIDSNGAPPFYGPDEVMMVTRALAMLDARDQWLITERFFKERTLRSIAEDKGVTREAVRQRQNNALGRLKDRVSELQQKGMN